MERISQADKDAVLIAILKKQQETIKEQRELIEHLWAWAEERDEAWCEGKTPSEADAEAYLNLMYPIEEEKGSKRNFRCGFNCTIYVSLILIII